VGNDGILAVPIYEYICPRGHISDHWSPVEFRYNEHSCKTCGESATYKISAPRVFADYPGYISPATGKWVEGRRARMEDMRASGCRPYEVGEMQDAIRKSKEAEKELDAQVDVAVEQTIAQMHI
jgi:hypothetical protein